MTPGLLCLSLRDSQGVVLASCWFTGKCQDGSSFMFLTASPENKELMGDTVQYLRFQACQSIIRWDLKCRLHPNEQETRHQLSLTLGDLSLSVWGGLGSGLQTQHRFILRLPVFQGDFWKDRPKTLGNTSSALRPGVGSTSLKCWGDDLIPKLPLVS